MKRLLLITATLFLLSSCKTSKDYLSRGDEDKTLFDIVKKLGKHSNDEDAVNALPEVYARVQQNHLKKINTYKTYKEISRWDKIIEEYSTLQRMYETVSNTDGANRLVNAVNYQNDIYDAKQNAAADYYEQAVTLLQSNYRDDAKKAYSYFKKAKYIVKNQTFRLMKG